MKNIKPIPAIKQPLKWRQAISQSKFGKITWKNFYLYPLTKWWFSFKSHESTLFDYLIIGSNPVLTHLLVLKLYNSALKAGNKVKVAIYLTDESDYWAYHVLEEEKTWTYFESELNGTLGKSFQDFYQGRTDIFQDNSVLSLTIINNHNTSISYYNHDQKFAPGYIFHLGEKKSVGNDYQKSMPNVVQSENNIRKRYSQEYLQFLNKMSEHFGTVQTVHYSDKLQQSKDKEEKTHIVLSSQVFLTTLANWLNCSTTQTIATDYQGKNYGKTQFIHNLQGFGTAKSVANDFLSLEHQTCEDFIELYKGDIV